MHAVRRMLIAGSLLLLGGPGFAAEAPASAAGGTLSRERAVAILSACERAWYNQAALYRVRGARYESLETIDEQTDLFLCGYTLLVTTNERQIEETLADTRSSLEAPWRRRRTVDFFDGATRTQWTDYANRAAVHAGGRQLMLQDPSALYAFYGYLNSRRLSERIAEATEFYWSPELETVGGERCAIGHCAYAEEGAPYKERYEVALAVEGALFPMRIQRFIDRGDGERRTALWETTKTAKDEERRLWHVAEARFFNLGTESIYVLEVLARREITDAQDRPEAFRLQLPAGAASQPASAPSSARTHNEITFLPRFMNLKVADLERELNASYPEGAEAVWGE